MAQVVQISVSLGDVTLPFSDLKKTDRSATNKAFCALVTEDLNFLYRQAEIKVEHNPRQQEWLMVEAVTDPAEAKEGTENEIRGIIRDIYNQRAEAWVRDKQE